MIKLLNFKKKISFKKAELKESLLHDSNPSRGWYRVYHYFAKETVDENIMESVLEKDEQLALVEINIGYYKSKEIEQQALENIQRIFEFWKKHNKEIILRVIYDNEGRGMEKEPLSIKLVERHMEQLGKIIYEYRNIIFKLQGIFVGSWGEMHSSKFLSKENIKTLVEKLDEATGHSCILSVRKPVQWRIIYNFDDCNVNKSFFNNKVKVGLYNDAIMSSETDMGTYNDNNVQHVYDQMWSRDDEINFQNSLCRFVPNGGEVVNNSSLNDIDNAVSVMRKMHITYLNSLYDMNILDKWKKSQYVSDDCLKNISGYDYISMHLGYRFIIRDVKLDKVKGNTAYLKVSVENTGFANIYNEVDVYIIIVDDNGSQLRYKVDADAFLCESGKKAYVLAELSFEKEGTFAAYIMMLRKKDKHIITFANNESEDMTLLGSFTYCK